MRRVAPFSRLCALLSLCVVFQSVVPPAPVQAQSPTPPVVPPIPLITRIQQSPTPPPQTPVPLLTTQATPEPGLTFDIVITDTVSVGDTVPFSVTLINRATTAGEGVVVTLPVPDGAIALPGDGVVDAKQGWRWNVGHIDGPGQITLAGSLKLISMPKGQALLLSPQATAQNSTITAHMTRGAIALPRSRAAVARAFTPGSQANLQSADGLVEVRFPAKGFGQRLRLQHNRRADLNDPKLPPARVENRRGFGTFVLTASDERGSDVHQFNAPLTLVAHYTPEQLLALGLNENSLTLYWYNDTEQAWVTLPTTVDPATHTASAQVDHFSAYNLSDGSSPSAAYVPSLQGFQAGGFTGAASYSIPIEVPAGPGGFKPSLSLSYSSSASDGSGGTRPLWQAGPVGKGWSFDAGGSVSLNKSTGSSDDQWDNFSLVFDGHSYDMVKGELLPGYTDYTDTNPAHWSWNATDESFVKLRKSTSGDTWTAWAKDGTRFDFTQPLRWGINTNNSYETYKWLLTSVTNTAGNVITYDYQIDSLQSGQSVQPTWFLRTIAWGGLVPGTSSPRFAVTFDMSPRWSSPTENVDLNWEYTTSRVMGKNGTPHEAYRIDAIRVKANAGAGLEQIRAYKLNYATYANSLTSDVTNGQRVLTLANVQRLGSDNTALPATTFTYGMSQGNSLEPTPGWNRLLTIDNGQGGKITFTYEHVWGQGPADYARYYQNYYRVSSVLQEDTSGKDYSRQYLTTYSYIYPALNDYDHSATVVYARYPESGNGDSRFALARQEKTEFRGHYQVGERVYDGPTTASPLLRDTETWYYQGNGGADATTCAPAITTPSSGNQYVAYTDPCYRTMSDRERWKGKVIAQEVYGNGARLTRTDYTYTRINLPFFGLDGNATHATQSNNYKRAGLWRAFNYTSQVVDSTYEGSGTPRTRTVNSTYDCTPTNTSCYGNLLSQTTLDDAGAVVRTDKTWYATRDDANTYIVDRPWQNATLDGQNRYVALSNTFYDYATSPTVLGTSSLPTRTSRYYDVPLQTDLTNTTLHSTDATFTYDAYGNQITQTTYKTAYGTRTNTNGSLSFSAPAGGAAGRTTSIEYDPLFHALSVKVTNPLNQVEQAAYDYRMGTLTSVTDLNGITTSAAYDVFGRMTSVTTPDYPSAPSLYAYYYDAEKPFRYLVQTRTSTDISGDYLSDNELFYDGLGRQVQTRRESQGWGVQSIVTDMRYNALGNLVTQSQPRYQNETGSSYYAYLSAGSSLFRPTTTTYDALGRVRVVTAPNGTTTQTNYSAESEGLRTTVIDSNSHATSRWTDSLGRLKMVREFNGTTSPRTLDTTTQYAYDALDRLYNVQDALGNPTWIAYDSLGRKTGQNDPDMGVWSYGYDAAGNLGAQTDAKGQTIYFGYDALDRVVEQAYPNGSHAYYGYDATGVNVSGNDQNYGVGHRTSMSTVLANGTTQTFQRWEYDKRGRESFTGQNSSTTGVHHVLTTYDTAGRVKTVKYQPTDETVTYSYDAASRPYSLCTDIANNPCYITAATYDAMNQPLGRWSGGGAAQAWTYEDLLARLQTTTIYASSGVGAFSRNFWYDNVGNLKGYGAWDNGVNNQPRQVVNFGYDDRDRLSATSTTGDLVGSVNETYGYDKLGNLTSKAGISYAYGANGNGTGAGAHQARTIGGQSYTYDANGNLTSGGGRTYSWDAANRPTSVTAPAGEEVVDGTWQAAAMPHLIGRADGDGWSANITNDSAGFLQYGPYQTLNTAGAYTAHWSLAIDNNTAADGVILRVDVADSTTGTVIASREIRRQSWATAGQYQEFTLPFVVDSSRVGHLFEYRVFWVGGAYVKEQKLWLTHKSSTVTESYIYDADGNRAASIVNGQTTATFDGLFEDALGVNLRKLYTFNGQVVAQRDNSGVTYLHGDHLGSVSVVTNGSGSVVSKQEYDAWGSLRAGGIAPSTTTLNYTGQRRDGTGLLYYNARYYDPAIGRFISADTVVPGNPSGGMDGVALKTLTMGFHEAGFAEKVNQENQFGPWYTLSDDEQQQLGIVWGPDNVQALNRYSYVQNNPLKWTDPSGHCPMCLVAAPLLVLSAPAWLVPVAIGIGIVAVAGVVGYIAAKAWQGYQANRASSSSVVSESRAKNPAWKDLKPFRGKTKTNGESGKNRRYYEKDMTHGDVEVYDSNGKHLGSMDPETGEMTKPAVPGRKIDV